VESKHKTNDLYIGNVYLPTGELKLCGHTRQLFAGRVTINKRAVSSWWETTRVGRHEDPVPKTCQEETPGGRTTQKSIKTVCGVAGMGSLLGERRGADTVERV
jgi:hypothetical protein